MLGYTSSLCFTRTHNDVIEHSEVHFISYYNLIEHFDVLLLYVPVDIHHTGNITLGLSIL